jgi:hypothetical protein
VADLILQNPRGWNEPLIRKMFLFHEAEEILNLRIPASEGDDILSWHYEKSGLFSVRSAYKLAMEGRSENNCGTSMSADRKIFDTIWKTPVPQKVKIFIWKLVHNGLGVQSNRLSHHIILDATCQICGMEPEDGHHAMVRCTFASALRHALRQSCNLPDDSAFTYTGPGWILALLNSANKDLRAKLMLLFWRIWHHRNDIVFGNGQCPISASVIFLENYLRSLKIYGDIAPPVNAKGKNPCSSNPDFLCQNDQSTTQIRYAWTPPLQDGSNSMLMQGLILSRNRQAWVLLLGII